MGAAPHPDPLPGVSLGQPCQVHSPLPSFPGSWDHLLCARSSRGTLGSFTVSDHGLLSPALWPTILRVRTPGLLVPWLSEFDFTVISLLILVSSEGNGEMADEYIFHLSEGCLLTKPLDNDLLSILLNGRGRCSACTSAYALICYC